MRDYVIQFVPDLVNKLENNGVLVEQLAKTLFNMTEIRQDSIAGTALLKLQEFAPAELQGNLAQKALEILQSTDYTAASKVGAANVLATFADGEHLEVLKDMASDSQIDMQLRAASMNSYASLVPQDSEFYAYLTNQSVDKNTDKRLRWAAQSALKKLNNKEIK